MDTWGGHEADPFGKFALVAEQEDHDGDPDDGVGELGAFAGQIFPGQQNLSDVAMKATSGESWAQINAKQRKKAS